MQKETLTVEETASLLGIGRNTAYAAVRSGAIPTVRIGKRYLVPKVALAEWLRSARELNDNGQGS